jgi:multidrug efflux pump subunit AcrB
VLLLYLILVAQFESLSTLIILLAIPLGLSGVLAVLYLAGTTLNVQSLMGVVMMVGCGFEQYSDCRIHASSAMACPSRGVAAACRIRLRSVLMTSLATIIGLLPMAMKLGTGSESHAPLAQAIIGADGIGNIHGFLVPPLSCWSTAGGIRRLNEIRVRCRLLMAAFMSANDCATTANSH